MPGPAVKSGLPHPFAAAYSRAVLMPSDARRFLSRAAACSSRSGGVGGSLRCRVGAAAESSPHFRRRLKRGLTAAASQNRRAASPGRRQEHIGGDHDSSFVAPDLSASRVST